MILKCPPQQKELSRSAPLTLATDYSQHSIWLINANFSKPSCWLLSHSICAQGITRSRGGREEHPLFLFWAAPSAEAMAGSSSQPVLQRTMGSGGRELILWRTIERLLFSSPTALWNSHFSHQQQNLPAFCFKQVILVSLCWCKYCPTSHSLALCIINIIPSCLLGRAVVFFWGMLSNTETVWPLPSIQGLFISEPSCLGGYLPCCDSLTVCWSSLHAESTD